MKKVSVLIIAAVVISVFMTGCGDPDIGNKQSGSPESSNSVPNSESDGNYANPDSNSESDGNYANPDSNFESDDNYVNPDSNSALKIDGSVVSFEKDSCTITPSKTFDADDGGKVGVVAAPGQENPDENVVIHYQDNCEFQIGEFNAKTGAGTYSDAGISDVKKESSLIVYGEWTDKHNFNATKVIIARFVYE